MAGLRGARRESLAASAREPLRTCLGCRRVRPQAGLLRLVRTADGIVELDTRRERGGRGAYVCPSERCLAEAVRRGRWAHAFRGAAALAPGTLERVRALCAAEPEVAIRSAGEGPAGCRPAAVAAGRVGESAKGGW